MSEHKALILDALNADWKVSTRPTPKPGKGEVLVKALAVALNPVDWYMRRTGLYVAAWPVVVGFDVAGTIAEVGEDVTGLKIGDRVVHCAAVGDNNKSAFQQYVIVPAYAVSTIPSSLSFDEAASLPVSLATPAVGFYDSDPKFGIGLTPSWLPEGKGKYKGQSLVVYGGSSSIGQGGLQLGSLSGFSPIIAVCSSKHEGLVKSFGATHVVDRNATDVKAEILKIIPEGADVVFNAISSPEAQAIGAQVAKKSTGAIVLSLPPAEGVDFGDRKVAATFGSTQDRVEVGTGFSKALPELLESGQIKPNPVEVLPGGLGGIDAGMARLEGNQVSGVKLIVRPWE